MGLRQTTNGARVYTRGASVHVDFLLCSAEFLPCNAFRFSVYMELIPACCELCSTVMYRPRCNCKILPVAFGSIWDVKSLLKPDRWPMVNESNNHDHFVGTCRDLRFIDMTM